MNYDHSQDVKVQNIRRMQSLIHETKIEYSPAHLYVCRDLPVNSVD